MPSKVCLVFGSESQSCLKLNRLIALLPHPFNQVVFSADVDWHERHEFLKCM